jgi:hypothetical protein
MDARACGEFGCWAETDWQKRTKRSDFVLTVRLSVVQGLASRLGLSNDIPNELNPDFGCCDSDRYPNGTRQFVRSAGLAWFERIERGLKASPKNPHYREKNLDFSQNLQTGTKRGH